jgi:RND family efflux transporter MFP subunit
MFMKAVQKSFSLACIAVSLSSCSGAPPSQQEERVYAVKLFTVQAAIGAPGRQFPGIVQASTAVELGFRVSGPLIDLPVTSGGKKKEGEIIARIDPRDFQTRLDSTESALSEARAQLDAMKAGARPEEIEIAEATISAARATYEEANAQYDRLAKLIEEDVGTQSEVDRQRQLRDVAQAELSKAEQSLKAAADGARMEDLQAMEARIAGLESQRQDASNAMADTTLLAPFDGIVAVVHVDNREIVQANQPIVRIQDETALEINIQVSESDIATGPKYETVEELAQSLNIEAEFAALPDQRFPAILKDFESQADPQTQTFAATFLVTPPDSGQIRPGMNATLYGKPHDGAAPPEPGFWLPVNAVFSDSSGESKVWLVDPNTSRIAEVVVTIGSLRGEYIQVLSGADPGDVVAASAVNSLQTNMKVRAYEPGDA